MSKLDAKVNALINASESSQTTAPASGSAHDTATGAPPTGSASGAESGAGESSNTAPSAGGAPAAPSTTMADLFAEKLAKVRADRRASTALRDAEAKRKEADRDREAVAKERALFAEGRKDIRKFIEANGMSPKEAYEEMTRQAIEADTPEAKLRAAQEAWKAELAETIAPLKKTIEELTAERDAARSQNADQGFATDFQQTVTGDAFKELRVEYSDAQLLEHAKRFRDDPRFFHDVAKEYSVTLTNPGRGFTMLDILNVLKSVQDKHREGVEKRRAALAPPQSEAAEQAASPTVNGTAARRNAGQTIGNDLATARAADGKFIPKGATAAQRVRERTRRLAGG